MRPIFARPAASPERHFAAPDFAQFLARSGGGMADRARVRDPGGSDRARGHREPKPAIAFLFNAQAHQLLHGITIAEALADRWQARIDILSASQEHLDLARRALLDKRSPHIGFGLLGSRPLRALAKLTGSVLPPKILTLLDARRQLNSYDAIVLPERTSTIMRRMGVTRPKLVHADHGAGDRAGGFDRRIAKFDFALVAGEKQRARMLRERLIRPEAHAVVGYAKFDAADRLRDPHWTPFADPKPVVLYNPHFSAELGSWPRDGLAIVDAIARDGRYNLIVAPHIRLCDDRRTRARMRAALAPYAGMPNVHVDLGSFRSIDMSYTMLADVYLGDVSSQIYEYLREPRPALFINSHDRAWEGDENYAHWRFGPVIEHAVNIVTGVELAIASHRFYRREQERAFAATFAISDTERSSARAADALAYFMGLEAVAS